mgnify:CR=1 FL=1
MKAIGIVLAGGNNRMMRELTNKRAIASIARNAGRRETRLSLYVCNLYQKTDRKPGTFRQITGSIPIDLRHIPVIVEFQFYERSRVQLHFISPIVTSRFDNSGSRILCSDISQQITRQNIYL